MKQLINQLKNISLITFIIIINSLMCAKKCGKLKFKQLNNYETDYIF